MVLLPAAPGTPFVEPQRTCALASCARPSSPGRVHLNPLARPAPPLPQSSQLIIRPSATLDCKDCVKEQAGAGGEPTVLLVPPGLPDAQLLPLLEPYKKYRVWRLSFEGVGAAERAYGGFADVATAKRFDQRMERMTTTFCCRCVLCCVGGWRACCLCCACIWLLPLAVGEGGAARGWAGASTPTAPSLGAPLPLLPRPLPDLPLPPLTTLLLPWARYRRRAEEAPRYHKEKDIVVKLSMTRDFNYSHMAQARSQA